MNPPDIGASVGFLAWDWHSGTTTHRTPKDARISAKYLRCHGYECVVRGATVAWRKPVNVRRLTEAES